METTVTRHGTKVVTGCGNVVTFASADQGDTFEITSVSGLRLQVQLKLGDIAVVVADTSRPNSGYQNLPATVGNGVIFRA